MDPCGDPRGNLDDATEKSVSKERCDQETQEMGDDTFRGVQVNPNLEVLSDEESDVVVGNSNVKIQKASSTTRLTCCNPLNPPKHCTRKENRRHKVYKMKPFFKSKYSKLFPGILEGAGICGTCRIAIEKEGKKFPQFVVNLQSKATTLSTTNLAKGTSRTCEETTSAKQHEDQTRMDPPPQPSAEVVEAAPIKIVKLPPGPSSSIVTTTSSASIATSSDLGSLYETRSTIAEDANSFLKFVAVSPLIRMDDAEVARKYLRAKNSAKKTLFQPLLADQKTELSPEAGTITSRCSNARSCSACNALVEDLQEKFPSCSRQDQFKILTVLPLNFGPSKIAQLFPCSIYMAKRAKNLRIANKAFTSPQKRSYVGIPETVVAKLIAFYLSEANSRINPEFRRTVRVRPKDGGPVTYEAGRYIMTTLEELYREFREENPYVKISISKFASLRPVECLWSGLKELYNTCTCEPHQNFKLLLAACALPNAEDVNEHLTPIFCNTSSSECMLGYCEDCPLPESIENMLINLDEDIDTVSFKMWSKEKETDGVQLHTKNMERNDFIEHMKSFVPKFGIHHYKTREQKKFIVELKATVVTQEEKAIMWVDFAMNYNCVVQNAPQSFHWVNIQVTLLPCVIMFGENGELKKKKYIVISDCLTHDATVFHVFRASILKLLKPFNPRINHIFTVSDGTPAQFKNTKNLLNLMYHETEFGMTAEHHCTTTAHGKSECDGLGAICKKAARMASLALDPSRRREIMDAKAFYDFILSKFDKSTVEPILVTQQHIQEYTTKYKLDERYAQVKCIKGTSKCHGFIPLEGGKLHMKELSNQSQGVMYQVIKATNEKQNQSISTFTRTPIDSLSNASDEIGLMCEVSPQPYMDGDWVAVKRAGFFIIGNIIRQTDEGLEVATMKQSTRSNFFTRFAIDKLVICDSVDILCKIQQPVPNRTERYYTLSQGDFKTIQKMCK